jgi:hypothetical protein
MVSQKVYELCRSNDTVTSVLAQDPSLSPGDAQKNLYGKHLGRYDENKDFKEPNPTAEDLKRTYECGKWGPSKPSELFLKVCPPYRPTHGIDEDLDLSRCHLHPGARPIDWHGIPSTDG